MTEGPHRTSMWRVSPWDFDPEITKNFNFAKNIQIHDVSLRDGEQETGVVFTAKDKIEIAKKLAKLGVHRIEAGMPAVSKEDEYAVKAIKDLNLGPKVFAFTRCIVDDVVQAAKAGCDGIVMEIAANKEFVEKAYGKSFDWAKKAAIDATAAAKEYGMYSAFFTIDGTRSDSEELCDMLEEVSTKGHMDSLVVADTFGCCIPEAYAAAIRKLKARFNKPVEAHCHMHFGLGVANTLAALAAGADVAHVTVAGIGEGAGNTPIEDVVMSLLCMYGVDLGLNTEHMLETAKYVCSIANDHAIPVNRPILGSRVFEVESGIGLMFATNAAKADDLEILYTFNPALVGQKPIDFVVGKKSGTYSINLWLERIGRLEDANEDQVLEILGKVKDLAFVKKDYLSEEEFVAIVNEVIGEPKATPKRGTPLIDQQVARAGKAWLEAKSKK